MLDRYIHHKKCLLESGELAPRSFERYEGTCDMLIEAWGLHRSLVDVAGDDFQSLRASMAKRWGPVTTSKKSPLKLLT